MAPIFNFSVVEHALNVVLHLAVGLKFCTERSVVIGNSLHCIQDIVKVIADMPMFIICKVRFHMPSQVKERSKLIALKPFFQIRFQLIDFHGSACVIFRSGFLMLNPYCISELNKIDVLMNVIRNVGFIQMVEVNLQITQQIEHESMNFD